MKKKVQKLFRLFWEFFKIALFVLGGGYAIIVVADRVFGKRLKWLREGELLDHLPVFQMVPGLIAGNSAIYVGLKTAGRLGAAVALFAVALPSYIIFLGVSCGYALIPPDNPWINGALLGLRAAITGLVAATLVKGWRKSVNTPYAYATVTIAILLIVAFNVNVVFVLLAAMCAGIIWKLCGGATPSHDDSAAGVEQPPLSTRARIIACILASIVLALVTCIDGRTFWTFVKFGFLGFGGGYALVPFYLHEFVGAAAPQLQLPPEEFANLMALTQTTPGPISINAATFFGYRLDGVLGAAVATTGLMLPSFVLLTTLLTGLARWKQNRMVQGLLWGVRPATNALILNAAIAFAGMSVCTFSRESFAIHPYPLAIAVFAALMLLKSKLSVMLIIFICAALGLLIPCF